MLASLRALLPYGVRSYGIDLLGALSLQIDQALVVGFLSPAAMGTYVVALSLSRMLQLFQQAVVMVLFPKAAGRPADEVIALTGQAARISTVLTSLAGIGCCTERNSSRRSICCGCWCWKRSLPARRWCWRRHLWRWASREP
jgi:O-antigen/teichoic acid export membrane protein